MCVHVKAFYILLKVQRNKKVFIGGVPSDATVADIINHFKQFGEVQKLRVNNSQLHNFAR